MAPPLVESSGGKPVQIVKPTDGRGFEIDLDILERILLADDVKGKPVVVVSVVGAFRKGKSFLLDFFLRYMRNRGDDRSWLGEPSESLQGFKWRGGCDRETTGILLWDEVFHVTTSKGEEIAVLFMDTQGTFDCQSTMKESTTIFAMSTLISSVQIYNLSGNIQEDDLQHLCYFSDYGRLVKENTDTTPFQKLLVLVRDWSCPYQFPYGQDGGHLLLESRLHISDKQEPELRRLREHIRSFFSKIDCFLMPYPGEKVATSEWFDGRLDDISESFKVQLARLVESVLQPDRLVVKKLNGQEVTCKALLHLFKAYAAKFKHEDLPQPKTMFETTAELDNLNAVERAKDAYTSRMQQVCGPARPYMSRKVLEEHHYSAMESALNLFTYTPKMGGNQFSRPFLDKLEQAIGSIYSNFAAGNNAKKPAAAIWSTARASGPPLLKSSRGKPVQIVKPTDGQEFEIDLDILERILLADDVKDKPVVVVSVVGAFRKGKSFLLNFLLRYMRNSGGDQFWLGELNEPLEGFNWRGGCERETTGILVWDEVFHMTTSKEEEIAVLFMDTQGTFDCQSTMKESTIIFALSTLISSVQIYNVSGNIQDDDLRHLCYFSDYGWHVMSDTETTAFQKLLFLVRDWSCPYEAPYGQDGGRNILRLHLHVSDEQEPELRDFRMFMRYFFSEIDCFLMPHPGETVATSEMFDGRLDDISNTFKVNLVRLVESVLKPDRLVVKNINGQEVTCKGLLNLFKVYAEKFKGEDLPQPFTLFQATAEFDNLNAVERAKDAYTTKMEEVCCPACSYVSSKKLEKHHCSAKESAFNLFMSARKMGGDYISGLYLEKLKQDVDIMYSNFAAGNKAKRPTAAIWGTAIASGACFVAGTVAIFLPVTIPGLGIAIVASHGLGLTFGGISAVLSAPWTSLGPEPENSFLLVMEHILGLEPTGDSDNDTTSSNKLRKKKEA